MAAGVPTEMFPYHIVLGVLGRYLVRETVAPSRRLFEFAGFDARGWSLPVLLSKALNPCSYFLSGCTVKDLPFSKENSEYKLDSMMDASLQGFDINIPIGVRGCRAL